MAVNDYIRQRFFPHLWCSGCGHGIVLNGMIRAVEKPVSYTHLTLPTN